MDKINPNANPELPVSKLNSLATVQIVLALLAMIIGLWGVHVKRIYDDRDQLKALLDQKNQELNAATFELNRTRAQVAAWENSTSNPHFGFSGKGAAFKGSQVTGAYSTGHRKKPE